MKNLMFVLTLSLFCTFALAKVYNHETNLVTEDDVANKKAKAYQQSTGGVVYERWGRASCPSQSELIYDGITASGFHAHTGGGATFVCLVNEPTYMTSETASPMAWMYSTEYEVSGDVRVSGTSKL